MDHTKCGISDILKYNPTEYMKPGIISIIMIHNELHNHFSLINVTDLLAFWKQQVQVLTSLSVLGDLREKISKRA